MVHAITMGRLNRLHVVPVWKHPFGKDMVDFDGRFTMVEKMVRPFRRFITVHDYERQYGTTYTIDLIEKMQEQTKANRGWWKATPDTYVLVIGQDNPDIAKKWHRWDELEKLVEILVVLECGPERSTLVREAYKKDDKSPSRR